MSSAARDDDIEATAVAWVIRMDRGVISDSERAELEAWLEADSRRMGAFVRASATWAAGDRIAALDVEHTLRTVKRPWHRWLLAASLAAVLGSGTVLSLWSAWDYFSGREATAVGEIRRLTLDDGSIVILNTASEVQLASDKDKRGVLLRQGEASFHVAHDPARPFIVRAGDLTLKAVGTGFSVRLQPMQVSVIVTEGVIEVMRATDTDIAEVRVLERNRELTVPREKPMSTAVLTKLQVANRLAWEDGLLVFDGEHLARAVEEVNRYSPVPVVIDSPDLRDRALIGVFRIGDSRAFAQAAAAAFHADVIETSDGLRLRE